MNTKRLRVTLVYEYETYPDNYPDQDPVKMATLDAKNDLAEELMMSLGADWKIVSAILT